MAGEEMLEAEVGGEVASCSSDAIVEERAVAGECERLWLLAPLQRFHVEEPDVPTRADDVGRVRVEVLRREGGDFRRAVALVAKIP